MNEVELERLAKAHRTAEALVMDLREAIVTLTMEPIPM